MAAGGVKKREHEKLTPGNIRYVAQRLEEDEKFTKKDACARLHIKYNTSRLNKIIEDQQKKDEVQARRKKEKAGKPATDQEIVAIIQDALDGDPIKDIADRQARSPSFISDILERMGVPKRVKGAAKFKDSLLPDECVSETFEEGEIAWSAIHHAPVVVMREEQGKYEEKYESKAYKVWVNESIRDQGDDLRYVHSTSGGYTAFVLAYDLGSLAHLQKLGVRIKQD